MRACPLFIYRNQITTYWTNQSSACGFVIFVFYCCLSKYPYIWELGNGCFSLPGTYYWYITDVKDKLKAINKHVLSWTVTVWPRTYGNCKIQDYFLQTPYYFKYQFNIKWNVNLGTFQLKLSVHSVLILCIKWFRNSSNS